MNPYMADVLNIVFLSFLVVVAIAVSYVKDLLYAAILLGAYSDYCVDLVAYECT